MRKNLLNEREKIVYLDLMYCIVTSDGEAEAEAGSGSAGSSYFSWKLKRLFFMEAEAEAVNVK